jgi:hypothetical protein
MTTRTIAAREVVWPTFEDGDDPFTIEAEYYEMFSAIPTFDIRNGDVSDARSLLMKATIPVAYHWVPVANCAPTQAMGNIEGFIKGHISYLTANMPATTTAATVRKLGICLGVARAVATAYYSIGNTDLVQAETADAILKLSPTTATRASGGYTARATLSAARKTALNEALALTTEEQAVVKALIPACIGIIPLQGYSLMMCQHHYLSQEATQSRRAFAVVEKQFWRNSDVSTWFGTDTALIQDALWHKACHPVNMAIKTASATSETIAQMLKSAGAGSAAARLPAVESEVRAANSYRTLLATVAPMYTMCQGGVAYEFLDIAIDTVLSFPVGVTNPARPPNLNARVPASVVDRLTACAWVTSLLGRNADKAAHCYGFYCTMMEQSNVLSGGAGTESLMTSHSLSKLKNQSHASFVAGQQFYTDYQSVRMTLRNNGSIMAPNLIVD